MKRRGFLAGIFGASVAAAAPKPAPKPFETKPVDFPSQKLISKTELPRAYHYSACGSPLRQGPYGPLVPVACSVVPQVPPEYFDDPLIREWELKNPYLATPEYRWSQWLQMIAHKKNS